MKTMNAFSGKNKYIAFIIFFLAISFLYAENIFIHIVPDDYRRASLSLRNELELITERDGAILSRCPADVLTLLSAEGIAYEQILSYEHFLKDELPPVAGGGVPLGLVVERGNQGSAHMGSFHPSVALAGDVLGYVETGVDGQLPGFTFRNISTDSTWHHFIDTGLDGDEPLYISAGETRIYYAFHYWGVSNSAMRYYCYDTVTGMTTEIENFGYGFEGFGVSDTWVMRVGSKGNGWNNQLLAHNVETEERFELLADSTATSWGYDYDNFGAPKTDGNTIVFTYTDSDTWSESLRAYSLGADGLYGTADDVSGSLRSGGNYNYWDVDGQYIFWVETAADENIMAYDMGADMLYGTADDGGVFTVCDAPGRQISPKADDGIIVWEDWRNSPSADASAPRDIYGYDIANDTEFRSTPSVDSIMIRDFSKGRVIMNRHDWDAPETHADILISHINGRILADYYKIDIGDDTYPRAQSLLTGTSEISSYPLSNVLASAKGPLSALFVIDVPSAGKKLLAYSAVSGDWTVNNLPYSQSFSVKAEEESGLVLGQYESYSTGRRWRAGVFHGRSGSYYETEMNSRPTGFAVGKNISLIWRDGTKTPFMKYYNAETGNWNTKSSSSTNEPWQVITTGFSDSLALFISGQGDTVCNNVNMEIFDMRTRAWYTKNMLGGVSRTLDRHSYKENVHIKINPEFAAVSVDQDQAYFDYVHTFKSGDSQWKTKNLPYSLKLDSPLIGSNFLLQGAISGTNWLGYIYNNTTGEWLPEAIQSSSGGITDMAFSGDMMLAWQEPLRIWAYSPEANGIKSIQLDPYSSETIYSVHPGEKMAFVLTQKAPFVGGTAIYTFNAILGEWIEPITYRHNLADYFSVAVSGHTGILLLRETSVYGYTEYKAQAYSALHDSWDDAAFASSQPVEVYASDFCGLVTYEDKKFSYFLHLLAYNAMDGSWNKDGMTINNTLYTGSQLDDRIILVLENGNTSNPAKVHAYSPVLNLWSSAEFSNTLTLNGSGTTPTAAYAWDDSRFRIIFNTDNSWESKSGELRELQVSDYALAATLYYSGATTTHYFYPPENAIINSFEFTEEPVVNILSSWAVEVTWKTNKDSDTRLLWGADNNSYELIKKDTLEFVKDHRVRIEGMEAQKTYYYAVASVIPGVDTVKTDTLSFNTGTDNTAPALMGNPKPYRIHNDQASVWWETNEPSTAILQWGLTSDYTDTLSYDDTRINNAVRMYDLIKDTTYHYRVGGYDRYGNGPFFSGDYTFQTHNVLPVPTNLAALDSTIWGCAYMNWEPPRLDSAFAKESFNAGIPVDWKIYNLGDNPRGVSWRSGYIGNNPVAYCSYGVTGEYQEEWLVTSPITLDHSSGGVLNFWHMGYYNDYDNAPNKVMVSMTGTNPEDFTTVWSSTDLPDDWSLVQIDLDWYNNYGKTMYIAFVYTSTDGEIWAIDDVYMDFDVDGFYEDFNNDANFWTQWESKSPGGASRFALKDLNGNYCAGVEGFMTAPETYQEMDYWMISPFMKITESHHQLGFWQMGWWSSMDNAANEVRVIDNIYSYETLSTPVKTIFPVPESWTWTTVNLSSYIGQTIQIAFRYHSYGGWLWDGEEWSDWYGEDWYIDDLYLYEDQPAWISDPNAQPGDKGFKLASSPSGQRIPLTDFVSVNTADTERALLALAAPEGSFDLPQKKPLKSAILDPVKTAKAPSALAEPLPELQGYEVYGRFTGQERFDYLGYVTSPSFIDWDTFGGYKREYYVEAVYDRGNSQPSERAIIKGGTTLAENEYAYDSGVFGYSYWWYPGNAFANTFFFSDSVLKPEKMKVHIEVPGLYSMRLYSYNSGGDLVTEYTSPVIQAGSRGWKTVDVPPVVEASNEFVVEFLPKDTIVEMSFEIHNSGASWFHYSEGGWAASEYTFFIRLIGEITGQVSIADGMLPETYKLDNNYPNPFNPVTTISFQLPEAIHTEIKVFDVRGALVRTLLSEQKEAGYHKLIWDGKDMKGNQLASGVYLYTMKAGDFRDTGKMVLVR
ncbi:MAG: choice-of-anchor J domain-containing protein [Fidelibacterota bacterium]